MNKQLKKFLSMISEKLKLNYCFTKGDFSKNNYLNSSKPTNLYQTIKNKGLA